MKSNAFESDLVLKVGKASIVTLRALYGSLMNNPLHFIVNKTAKSSKRKGSFFDLFCVCA